MASWRDIENSQRLSETANIAPQADGGAIVHRSMFSNKGYRLTRAEFERYLEWLRGEKKSSERWWPWIGLATLALMFAYSPLDHSALGVALVVSVLLLLAFAVWAMRRNSRQFRQLFPDAKRVTDPQRRTRRLLAYLTNPMYSRRRCIRHGIISVLIFGILIPYIFVIQTTLFWYIMYITLLCFMFCSSLFFLFMLYQQVLFRRQHGRAPTEEDLKALSALPTD